MSLRSLVKNRKQVVLSRLFIQTAGGFLTKIIGAGSAFLASVLFARLLGSEEFGIYAMVLAAANIAGSIAVLGLPMLVVQRVAAYMSGEQWGLAKGIIIRSHVWVGFAAFALAALGLAIWLVMPGYWEMAAVVGLFLFPLLSLNLLRAAVLRGLHWAVLADVPELLFRPLVIVSLIGLSHLLLSSETDSLWAIKVQLVSVGMSFLLGFWLLKQRMPKEIVDASPVYQDREWRVAALPFLGIGVLTMMESQVALLLLGKLTEAEQAGLYQAALQLVSLTILGLLAVNMALQSRLSSAWSQGDKEQAQKLVSEAARLSLLVAISVGGVLAVFAEQFLAIFGADYIEASTALKVLVLGQVVNAFAGSCGVVLAMTGHQKKLFHGVSVGLFANVSLCLLLIPVYGIVGAAVATSIGLIIWNTYMVYHAYKLTGLFTMVPFWRLKRNL